MKSAFNIICEKDEKKGFEIAKKLEQENDPEVAGALAVFYAEQGKTENNSFLLNALSNTTGYEKYALIDSYTKFLIKIDDTKTLHDGIDKLADIGRKASSRYMRQKAVNSLEDIAAEFENRISKSMKQTDEMKTSNASANDILIEESKRARIKLQRDELKATIADIKKNEKDKRLIKLYSGKE